MARASADVGLMLIAYNLRRLINILGINLFRKALIVIVLQFPPFSRLILAKMNRIFALTATMDNPVKNIKYLFFTFIFGQKLAVQRGL
jgi:hypothetical protein